MNSTRKDRRWLRSIKKKAIKSLKKSLIIPNRPRHKKVALNPLSEFVLLCFGVVLIASTIAANADDLTVTASIPAPTLTQSATIDSLQSNSTVTSSPITVFGSCPANSYVDLMRNGYFSGVAYCLGSGLYEIQTDLSPGVNDLVAQDYNVDNVPGPASPTVKINYNAPAAALVTSNGTISISNNGQIVEATNSPSAQTSNLDNHSGLGPLLLTTKYQYQAFTTANTYSWQMNLGGGTPPYSVAVDWGDGVKSNLFFNTDPVFTIVHHYKSSGAFNVVVNCIDNLGEKVVFQLTAVIRTPGSSKIGINKVKPTSGVVTVVNKVGLLKDAHKLLWLIWPTYVILILMVISFRLGEKRELQQLLNKNIFKKRS